VGGEGENSKNHPITGSPLLHCVLIISGVGAACRWLPGMRARMPSDGGFMPPSPHASGDLPEVPRPINDSTEHSHVGDKATVKEPKPYRIAMLVMTSVFMGYAVLVVMQHRLKNVHEQNCDLAHNHTLNKPCYQENEFKHASTLNYVGK
jgi:hypothetical protein